MMPAFRSIWPRSVLAVGLAVLAGFLVPRFGVAGVGLIIGIVLILAIAYLTFADPMIGVFALVFLLPFERLGSIEVAGFTLRSSQVIGLLLLLVWLLRVLLRKGGRLRSNPTLFIGGLYIVVALLSITQAPNQFRAVTVFGFVTFTILVSWLIPQFLAEAKQVRRLIAILFVTTTLVGVFGLFQFAGDLVGLPPALTGLRPQYTSEVFGFPRIQSTFIEPLYYANYLLIPLCLAVSFLLAGVKVARRSLTLIAIILLWGLNFVLTLSRGGYIALAVAFLVMGVIYWKKILVPHRVIIGAVLAGVILWGSVQFLGLTGDRQESVDVFTRQATGIFTGASYADRATTIEDAWVMFQEHPLLGVGVGNFGPVVAPLALVQPEHGWLIVNNEFLEILAETGILGFCAIILLLLILLIRTVRAIRKATDPYIRAALVGLLAAFIGVIIQYQTFSILYIMHIWFLFGLMVAVQNVAIAPQARHVELCETSSFKQDSSQARND